MAMSTELARDRNVVDVAASAAQGVDRPPTLSQNNKPDGAFDDLLTAVNSERLLVCSFCFVRRESRRATGVAATNGRTIASPSTRQAQPQVLVRSDLARGGVYDVDQPVTGPSNVHLNLDGATIKAAAGTTLMPSVVPG